jgi:hypothetical protein
VLAFGLPGAQYGVALATLSLPMEAVA